MKNFRVLIPVLFIFAIGFSSCESSKNISQETSQNIYSPCNDKLYLELQKRDSSTYTNFEKDYFHKKKDECSKFTYKTEHDTKQKVGEDIVKYVLIAGAILGAAFLLIFSGFKQ
ncbi:MAG: hypothetical protein JST55_12535 [Bacteroidetes bacterium]|nr:hypothetical protein [Bacteroidota bacterium]